MISDTVTELMVDSNIGEIPADWTMATFGDLFDIQQGKALNKKAREGPSPRLFLRTANVFWGELDLNKVDQMSFNAMEEAKYQLIPGDLLVCEGGEIGRTAIWRGELKGCYHQNHIHRCRVLDQRADPMFYMYWMQHAFLQRRLYEGHGNITTIANLSKSRLAAFDVAVPPLPEQRAIAHVLRTVQQAREATEQVIAAARELKRSLRQRLFSVGPRPTSVEVVQRETGVGSVPADWKVSELVDVLREPLKNGKSAPPTNTDKGVRTLTLTAVTQNDFGPHNTKLTSADEEAIRDLWLRQGDIFVERANTRELVGTAALYEGDGDYSIYPDLLIRVRPNEHFLLPKFLVEWLSTTGVRDYFRANASGTAGSMPKIGQNHLKRLPIPLPTLNVQEKIVDGLRSVDSKLAVEEQQRDALDTLFSSLLSELMLGHLRVPDSMWEPAA